MIVKNVLGDHDVRATESVTATFGSIKSKRFPCITSIIEVRSFTGPKIKGKFQMKLQKFQEFADFASKK